MMDQTAFLLLDLWEIATGRIEDSVEEGLKGLQKRNFDPENIGAEAKRKLIFQNLVQQIAKLAEEPSEAFVRMLLQGTGISHVRNKALSEHKELTRNAFKEFVNLRILQRLDLPAKDIEVEKPLIPIEAGVPLETKTDGIVTTEVELEVFRYVKRRLSFLVKEEHFFDAIENIEYRDYKGKFVVFYKRERAGRLFDFYETRGKKYGFDFGTANGGEIATDRLAGIDHLLLENFVKRVVDMSGDRVGKTNT